jgi:hypothetical protein
MRRIALLLLFLIPVVATSQRKDERMPTKDELAQASVVKAEELLADPDRYDKSLVRVNVLWVDGYHGSYVCPLDDETQCLGVECPDEDTCKDLRKVLDKNLTGEIWNMRGRFSVVGRFSDTKTPPGMNKLRFVLKVFKIDGVLTGSSY